MKKKLSALLTALCLLAGLALPAGAWEYPPRKYRTFQEYLDFYRSCEDEDTRALVEYIDARLAEGWAESFDADAYFEENMAGDGPGVSKGNWLGWNDDWHDAKGDYDEEWFHAEMLDTYLTQSYRAWQESNQSRMMVEGHPEEYAAFDPDAWFAGYYGLLSLTPEAYMEQEGLTAEGFKEAMFAEWAGRSDRNFFNGYCVTVDGVPVRFQFYRDLDGEPAGPKVENERILIPLRAAAEALGLTVEWKRETNQVVCANGERTVTFTLDSTEYSGGTLEAAPFAENGVTYLPLRALGETLGCGVTWYQDFATAALTRIK